MVSKDVAGNIRQALSRHVIDEHFETSLPGVE
jgi:hypothetical protein